MADDQQPPPQRFWFPWGSVAPPPSAPAHRPAVRPQLSRRDTRPAPQPSPPATPSPSRRQSHPQPGPAAPASRGAGGVPSPPAQPQPTRLSSRPSPSPARALPLSPIREPNARAAPAPAPELVPIAKEDKPPVKPATSPLHPTAHGVPIQKDIIIPQEKTIQEPPAADSKAQSKALEKEKEEKEKDKGKKEKEKEKEKKDKEKEKEHKDKKEKEKEHKEKKEKDKEEIKSKEVAGEHGSKLHKELKAGVADMVQKLSSSAPSPGGHERPASAAAGTTVITLAGENKGASMKVDTEAAAGSKDKERRGHKLDGSVVVAGKEQAEGKGLTAFVNSNVQVLNNSLLLQSSCNGRDPGVHLKLSTKSKKKRDGGEEAGGKSGSAAAPKK